MQLYDNHRTRQGAVSTRSGPCESSRMLSTSHARVTPVLSTSHAHVTPVLSTSHARVTPRVHTIMHAVHSSQHIHEWVQVVARVRACALERKSNINRRCAGVCACDSHMCVGCNCMSTHLLNLLQTQYTHTHTHTHTHRAHKHSHKQCTRHCPPHQGKALVRRDVGGQLE